MKAVAYQENLSIADPGALQDVELPEPVPEEHDLLVDVRAIAVNPVDTKIRAGVAPEPGQWKVLGWDAVGTVRAVGPSVTRFAPGDRVWYAGAIQRPGANSERHTVDERIAALAPVSLDDAQAAALPLTAITAWEMLFDRLRVPRDESGKGQALLVVGAAGGVGSIFVQLARQLTGLTVVGTASRPQTREWVQQLGAHAVIDHREPLAQAYGRTGLPAPAFVVSLTQTAQHFAQIAELIAPQGRLRSTLGERFGRISAENLRRAHALLESGQARGKIVLEGF